MIPKKLSIEAFNKQTDWLKTSRAVDSNFHAFWLAPVNWNILGYSLFWDEIIKWLLVSRDSFEK